MACAFLLLCNCQTTGSLNRLLGDIHNANVNIDYMYVALSTENGKALGVLRVPEIELVESMLTDKGYTTL